MLCELVYRCLSWEQLCLCVLLNMEKVLMPKLSIPKVEHNEHYRYIGKLPYKVDHVTKFLLMFISLSE